MAYVKPVDAHRALRRRGRSGEPPPRVGGDAVQQIAELPAGALRELLQRRQRECVKRVCLIQQRQEYVPRGASVAQRSVRRGVLNPQIARHILQRIAGHIGAQRIGEVVGVYDWVGKLNAVGAQKTEVEIGYLRYERRAADERHEIGGGALERRRRVHVPLRYARIIVDELRYAAARVDESLECVQRFAVLELDSANLYYGVFGVVKSGSFEVEGDPYIIIGRGVLREQWRLRRLRIALQCLRKVQFHLSYQTLRPFARIFGLRFRLFSPHSPYIRCFAALCLAQRNGEATILHAPLRHRVLI